MTASAKVASALSIALLLTIAACATPPRPAPQPPTSREPAGGLALDASLSPVAFRWLGEDSLLIAPDVGKRTLAAFGNYLERAAGQRERVRIAVWDDEAAWKRARDGQEAEPAVMAHKRALYVKNTSPPAPVDHYATFDRSGGIVYERDFRTYPLSELDDE